MTDIILLCERKLNIWPQTTDLFGKEQRSIVLYHRLSWPHHPFLSLSYIKAIAFINFFFIYMHFK